jgi:hypothetical protein
MVDRIIYKMSFPPWSKHPRILPRVSDGTWQRSYSDNIWKETQLARVHSKENVQVFFLRRWERERDLGESQTKSWKMNNNFLNCYDNDPNLLKKASLI